MGEIKSKLSNYPRVFDLSIRAVNNIYGSSIGFLDREYSNAEIKKIYNDNKKVLFEKGNNQKIELETFWTEEKFIRIIECIICYSDGGKLDVNLEKLNKILSDFYWDGVIEMYGKKDVKYTIACEKLSSKVLKLEAELRNGKSRNFFYKHILPKAILNDGKGHFYTSEELKYIADLRFKKAELEDIAIEMSSMENEKIRSHSMEDCRLMRKKSLESGFIFLYLSDLNLPDDFKKNIEDHIEKLLNFELDIGIDKDYGSFFRGLLSMVTGEDSFDIEYESPMSMFYYTKYIIACMALLGEIIGDEELKIIE